MRVRSADPSVLAVSLPYRIWPFDGRASVASIVISVDFPAPLGPSSPRISPDRALKDTFASARRRPKWREMSTRGTESKAAVTRSGRGSGPDVVVQRAVDLLQRGHQPPPSRRVPASVPAAPAGIPPAPSRVAPP